MKVRAACLAGVVVVLLSSVVAADAPPRNLDELRAQVARVLLREHVPGAGIALVDGQQILWAGGVGVADRASGRPVTADTLFRVGSITKSFVALALVKLAEQGRVDLNARVSDLAPELQIHNRWDAEQPISVAHLLEHTAGFERVGRQFCSSETNPRPCSRVRLGISRSLTGWQASDRDQPAEVSAGNTRATLASR